jgi:hypothetical protein
MDTLHTLYSSIEPKLKFLQSLPKKNKLQQLEKLIPFERCFSVKGVQGITGILRYRSDVQPTDKVSKTKSKKTLNHKTEEKTITEGLPIVFKISSDINLCVEHERDVLQALNSIRDWCPHFVGYLGYITVPIANDFIYSEKQHEEEEENIFERRCISDEEEYKIEPGTLRLWENSEDFTNRSMILMEYIGLPDCSLSYSLHHMGRYGSMQQNLAQMIMVLCALETAQQELQFVHYDTHLDNILLKSCNEDLVFVYKYANSNDFVIVPTLGHYPIMIDMGSSFCKNLIGDSVKTSISFYSSGLQPTVFDQLNDVHHFLFRCIDRLEMFNDRWRDIGTKLMHIFRHLPLWRYKGWKKLPSNLLKRLLKTICNVYPDIIQNEFWHEYTYEIMDLLVISTTIHWKQDDGYSANQDSLKCELEIAIRKLDHQLRMLDAFDGFDSDNDILLVIRELAELSRHVRVGENRELILPKDQEEKVRQAIGLSVGKLPSQFSLKEMVLTIYQLGRIFSHLLALYLRDNMELIHQAYCQIKLKRPLDAVRLLQQMVPFRYRINSNTIFRVFDSEKKRTLDIPISELQVPELVKSELTRSLKEKLHTQITNYCLNH